VAGNTAGKAGAAIFAISAPVTVDRCILALNAGAGSVACGFGTAAPAITCTDIFGNAGGDWTGCIVPQAGVGGNTSTDPGFCDLGSGDVSLRADSPLAAGISGCGMLGAGSVSCAATSAGQSVTAASWGRVKSLYR
jgi:hypothetical protein